VRAAALALAVTAGALAAPTGARAQCGKPDLVDMIPPDGATGVPPNAKLAAHYAQATEYLGEDVVLVHPDGSEQLLPAVWESTEQRLSVTPTSALTGDSVYEIRWPVLRGLNAAAPGLGGKARFTTGTAFDTSPPTFVGVVGLSWDLERKNSDCVDDLVERFVFDVDLGAASDDGGTSGLTLMLFQTKGPQVLGMPTPIPARAWPQSGTRAQVKLVTSESVGEVCFAGIVRDTIGQISQSGDVEACVHTTDPPFFRGCSVSGPGAGNPGHRGTLASLALIGLVLIRRRPMRART
jgi:MYXO-CTERM domain-containing protein